jgi:hypothetical protein
MSGWLIRLRDRPIADHERRQAFIASTVLLALTVGLLALTTPTASTTTHAGRRTLAARPSVEKAPLPSPSVAGDGSSTPGLVSQSVEGVARRFLTGYLAYLYGHSGVAGIRDASGNLDRSLGKHPPRVSLTMRTRHPHVVSLASVTAPDGAMDVSAVIDDGGIADYTIDLLVSRDGGRLLVTGIGGAR